MNKDNLNVVDEEMEVDGVEETRVPLWKRVVTSKPVKIGGLVLLGATVAVIGMGLGGNDEDEELETIDESDDVSIEDAIAQLEELEALENQEVKED